MPEISKKNILEIMKNSKWITQVFNALPLYITAVGVDSGWMLTKKLAINYSHFLLLFSSDKVARYYYDEADFNKIGKAFYEQYKTIEQVRALIESYYNEYNEYLTTSAIDTPLDSIENILSALKNKIKLITYATNFTHMIEGIEYYTEAKLKLLLRDIDISDNELSILCSPTSISNFFNSQEELWRIKNSPNNYDLVEAYIKDYSWCDATYIGCPILNQEEVWKRAKAMENRPVFKNNINEKQEIINRLDINDEVIFFIKVIEMVGIWHDERKKNILQTIEKTDRVINLLAKQMNLDLEILKYCFCDELTLTNLKNPEFIKILEIRRKGMALYATPHKNVVFTDNDYSFLIEKLVSNNESTKEITGTVASHGYAKGKVVICRSITDLERVQTGDILVTSMTRPEFMPAMQRAAGFVTDEGGLTCHAAIISREMNKPCIIGTKNATEILRDGDEIEVDANNGIIKLIKI